MAWCVYYRTMSETSFIYEHILLLFNWLMCARFYMNIVYIYILCCACVWCSLGVYDLLRPVRSGQESIECLSNVHFVYRLSSDPVNFQWWRNEVWQTCLVSGQLFCEDSVHILSLDLTLTRSVRGGERDSQAIKLRGPILEASLFDIRVAQRTSPLPQSAQLYQGTRLRRQGRI